MPHPKWSWVASRGSSNLSLAEIMLPMMSTHEAPKPQMMAAQGSTTEQPAVMAAKPPRRPLHTSVTCHTPCVGESNINNKWRNQKEKRLSSYRIQHEPIVIMTACIAYHKKPLCKEGVESSHASSKGGGGSSAANKRPVTLQRSEKKGVGNCESLR